MKKQNNPVAKYNFNKGGAHKDKSKTLPRDKKYQEDFYQEFHATVEDTMDEIRNSDKKPVFVKVTSEEDITKFVESLYADGRTPCERFGMSWEMLGEIEEQLLGTWVVDEEPYELLKDYHLRVDYMKMGEAAKEFGNIKRYLKEKGYSQTNINNINNSVLDELERDGKL